MDTKNNNAVVSGAQQVDEREHLAAGTTAPLDATTRHELSPDAIETGPVAIPLGHLLLSMFPHAGRVTVRVGSPTNSSELYEGHFPDAAEANTALLDAGILSAEQVPDPTQLLEKSLPLDHLTAGQLVEAGLERHNTPSM